ncbi:MAG: hypothetical protein ABH858_07690, partial [Candidatus Omnitrophota bacterium]
LSSKIDSMKGELSKAVKQGDESEARRQMEELKDAVSDAVKEAMKEAGKLSKAEKDDISGLLSGVKDELSSKIDSMKGELSKAVKQGDESEASRQMEGLKDAVSDAVKKAIQEAGDLDRQDKGFLEKVLLKIEDKLYSGIEGIKKDIPDVFKRGDDRAMRDKLEGLKDNLRLETINPEEDFEALSDSEMKRLESLREYLKADSQIRPDKEKKDALRGISSYDMDKIKDVLEEVFEIKEKSVVSDNTTSLIERLEELKAFSSNSKKEEINSLVGELNDSQMKGVKPDEKIIKRIDDTVSASLGYSEEGPKDEKDDDKILLLKFFVLPHRIVMSKDEEKSVKVFNLYNNVIVKDITGEVSWSFTNPAVVRIDRRGTVYAVYPGHTRADIIYEGNVVSNIEITVLEPLKEDLKELKYQLR